MNILQETTRIKEIIKELDTQVIYLRQHLNELYDSCDHDFQTVYSGCTEIIRVCSKCNFEENIRC